MDETTLQILIAFGSITFSLLLYRFISGGIACFFGHTWKRTGGHSTGASWSEDSKCSVCGQTKYESGNMFD